MDKHHRGIETLGQLNKAQSIEQTFVETAGRLEQRHPFGGRRQLLTQGLKARPWPHIRRQQAGVGRFGGEHLQGRNQLAIGQAQGLADEAHIGINHGPAASARSVSGVLQGCGQRLAKQDLDALPTQKTGQTQDHGRLTAEGLAGSNQQGRSHESTVPRTLGHPI